MKTRTGTARGLAAQIKSARQGHYLSGSRFLSAFSTLGLLLALVIFMSVGGLLQSAKPASARVLRNKLYVISYLNLDSDERIEELENDIDAMLKMGLSFTLPKKANGENGVMLVIEYAKEPVRVCEMLQKKGVCAVMLVDEGMNDKVAAEIFNYADRGVLNIAAPIEGHGEGLALFEKIAKAKLDFAARRGRSCGIFIHVCRDLVCGKLLNEVCCEALPDITLLVFGNGVNAAPLESGFNILTRIVKLPEWSIEEYFSSIVS